MRIEQTPYSTIISGFLKKEKFRHRYAHKQACEDEGRDWGDAAEAKTSSVISSKPPEARRDTWNTFSFIPCCNFDLELLAPPPEPPDNKFLLLKTLNPKKKKRPSIHGTFIFALENTCSFNQ